MAILNVPIQVRVDNEQNWDNSTLILKDGEPALCKKEDGTQELKFGDGQKTYKELSPFGGNKVEENSGDLLVTLTSIENNQASATYGQIKATINNKHLVAVIYEEQVYMLDKVQSNGTIEFRLDNGQGQKYLGISSSGVWYENSSSWQAVNISIDEIKGLEATNVQDALAELKEDGVQLNDNAVNATEAWSSKKIVDTLCPPFSVSGNPVTCNPVDGYPLSAVVTLEPKQAGTGDPSPENVRPITGRDEVTVTRCGKNLLDTSDSVRYAFNVNLPNATLVKGATYTFTVPNTVATDKFVALFVLASDTSLTRYLRAGRSETFTVPNDVDLSEGLMLAGGSATALDNVNPSDFMVELGSTPTPYEPYQGETYTLPLPETIYGGTVDAVTGVGNEEWYEYTITGEENLKVFNPEHPNTFFFDITEHKNLENVAASVICSHFKFEQGKYTENTFMTQNPGAFPDVVRIVFVLEKTINSIQLAKEFFAAQADAGTPVTVCYKLATPEPFQATGNQPIPALAGENTVYTDGDSLAVSGRSDPTAYIQQQISDAITAAVAITGGT